MKNNNDSIHTSEEQPSTHHEKPFISPDVGMMLLTWVTFFLLFAVLQKFAWKPILALLDSREKDLRQSLENADKVQKELSELDETRKEIIAKAESKGQTLLDQSRKAAVEAAKIIERKAREESQIMLENTLREIKDEKEKAQSSLRTESAQIAIALAGKLIEKNLDDKKNRDLVDQFIQEI